MLSLSHTNTRHFLNIIKMRYFQIIIILSEIKYLDAILYLSCCVLLTVESIEYINSSVVGLKLIRCIQMNTNQLEMNTTLFFF